jgi:asparagine synthase (glutamine-hydrolysing)
MSGFVGVIYAAPNAEIEARLTAMGDVISHRGEIQHTIIKDRKIGLISRMNEKSGYYTSVSEHFDHLVIFDGHLYNVDKLEQEFETKKGIAEIIWKLYASGAGNPVEKLLGSYSVVIYDKNSDVITLYRDPYGHRPLYFAQQDSHFWFASEIKPILQDPSFVRSVNITQLPLTLTYGAPVGEETLFEDIYKPMPGFSFSGNPREKLTQKLLFKPEGSAKKDRPCSDFQREIWELLKKNIEVQLNGCESNGLFLSGGLDSTMIAIGLAEVVDKQALAISCGYADDEALKCDESEPAKENAERYGLMFEKIMTSSSDDLLASIRNIIKQLEEPTRFVIAIPVERSFRKLDGRFHCLLTGVFADLLFGTEEYIGIPAYTKIKQLPGWLTAMIRRVSPLLGRVPKVRAVIQSFQRYDVPSLKQYILEDFRINPNLRDLIKPKAYDEIAPFIQQLNTDSGAFSPEDEWSYIGLMMLFSYWNEFFEKLGSSVGVDVVHPFQTLEMHNLSLSMPYTYKIHGHNTKPCLREFAAKLISRGFAYRKKQIFASPLRSWLLNSKQLQDFAFGLSEPSAKVRGYLDPEAIDRCIQEYRDSVTEKNIDIELTNLIFILIGFEVWLEEFF